MNKYERIPDRIIDLHGKTARETADILDTVLSGGKYRHVRVITGKGTHGETGPVLKPFVRAYLVAHKIRFNPAKQADGGDGAVEVFLE